MKEKSLTRKNKPRDWSKIKIALYLFSKAKNAVTTPYEVIHNSGVAMLDYIFLRVLLQELVDCKWLKIIPSGSKGKANYQLDERGRKASQIILGLPKDHPLRDLDTFSDI